MTPAAWTHHVLRWHLYLFYDAAHLWNIAGKSRINIKRRLKPRTAQNLLGDKCNLAQSPRQHEYSMTTSSGAGTSEPKRNTQQRKVSPLRRYFTTRTKVTLLTAGRICSSSRNGRRWTSKQQRRDKVWCVAVSQLSMAADWIQTSPGCGINSTGEGAGGVAARARLAEERHADFTAIKICNYNYNCDFKTWICRKKHIRDFQFRN